MNLTKLLLISLLTIAVVKCEDKPTPESVKYLGNHQCRGASTNGKYLYDLNSIDQDNRLRMNSAPFKVSDVKFKYTDNDKKEQESIGTIYFFVCHTLPVSMYPKECKENYPPTTAIFVGSYKKTSTSDAEIKCWAVSQQKSTKTNANLAAYKGNITFGAA